MTREGQQDRREAEVITERIKWRDNFLDLQKKFMRCLYNRDHRAADIALTWRAMIPTRYRDELFKRDWEEHYIPKDELKPRHNDSDMEHMSALLNAFMNWAERQGIVFEKEIGDPAEVHWLQAKEAARLGDMETVAALYRSQEAHNAG